MVGFQISMGLDLTRSVAATPLKLRPGNPPQRREAQPGSIAVFLILRQVNMLETGDGFAAFNNILGKHSTNDNADPVNAETPSSSRTPSPDLYYVSEDILCHTITSIHS
jgi:hypothetical protein